jgi:hypothetical protein
LEFKSNKSLHRLQDAQAFRLEIFNALLLWAMGIINQQAVAQTLGYQDPIKNFDEPPQSPLLGPLPAVGISAKDAVDAPDGADQGKKVAELINELTDLVSEIGQGSVSATNQG